MKQLAFPRQTQRLLVRPLLREDRDAIHSMYGDWAVIASAVGHSL